jgi:hypothetical protein
VQQMYKHTASQVVIIKHLDFTRKRACLNSSGNTIIERL